MGLTLLSLLCKLHIHRQRVMSDHLMRSEHFRRADHKSGLKQRGNHILLDDFGTDAEVTSALVGRAMGKFEGVRIRLGDPGGTVCALAIRIAVFVFCGAIVWTRLHEE